MGVLIDGFSIIIGGAIGLLVQKFFNTEMENAIFKAAGLYLSLFAILTFMQHKAALDSVLLSCVLLISLFSGAIIGTALNMDDSISVGVKKFQDKIGLKDEKFAHSIVVSAVVFGVGAMAILGPVEEVLSGELSIILTKSIIDFITAVGFAASLGIGVLFSSIPVMIFEALVMLLAYILGPIFTETMIDMVSLCGSILLLGNGLNLLDIKPIAVVNFLPGIVIIAVITGILEHFAFI